METIKNNIKLVIGGILAIGALILAFLFERSKAQTAEALNENVKTKEKLLKIDEEIAVNNAGLKEEEIKRGQLREDIKKEQDKEVTSDDVVDFFNSRK